MSKNLFLFVFILFTLSHSLAKADISIEPYIGLAIGGEGETNFGTLNQNGIENNFSGIQFGSRVGYSTLGFTFGIDFSLGSISVDSSNPSTSFYAKSDNLKVNQTGIFVSYQLPILFRMWGTYFINANASGDDQVNLMEDQLFDAADDFSSGSGIALGVGYTGLPFVSLNLEYRKLEYENYKVSDISSYNFKNFSINEIFLSVSLPLEF